MQDNKTAIIIGAGVGGIATAVFLAKSGYKVSVYEKNAFPGGRCGQIIRDGHRFDIGATIMLMPNLYREVFRAIGYDFDSLLQCIPVNNLYKLFFEDGKELEITPDPSRMEKQLEAIEEGSYQKLQAYLIAGYQLYETAFGKLLGRNFYHARQFINLNSILLLFRLKAFVNHDTYVRRFFSHPHLKMAFTFQNIYVGQSPYDAPALFSMLPAIEMNEGSYFLKGGMYGIVEKLMEISENYQVKFYFDNPVNKIEVNGNRVTEVIFKNGQSASADIVVANADLPYVYRELLPDRKKAVQINKMRYSCSAFVFHWGLDKIYPELGLHNVILSDNYKENLNSIFKSKTLGDKPDFYIYAPSRIDPESAPEGGDSLSVIVPVGHIDRNRNQDWGLLEVKARSYILKRLKKMNMTDIEQHIKFEIPIVPEAWESQINVSRGGVFGSLSHNIMQMGYFRPHNRHDRYRNLYFVGGSTHPGSGVPLVLLSAKLVSERILSGK